MDPKCNRIYIIGSVESGKTELARKLSGKLGIAWYELDNVIWERHQKGNSQRPSAQRDTLFETIIASERWIIEDVLRPCFSKGLKKADLIILLDPPGRKSRLIALVRWIKRIFRVEKSRRQPKVSIMKSMQRWTGDSGRNKNDFMKRLEPYRSKIISIKSPGEIDLYF